MFAVSTMSRLRFTSIRNLARILGKPIKRPSASFGSQRLQPQLRPEALCEAFSIMKGVVREYGPELR